MTAHCTDVDSILTQVIPANGLSKFKIMRFIFMNPSKMKYFKNNYSVSSIVIVMLSGR